MIYQVLSAFVLGSELFVSGDTSNMRRIDGDTILGIDSVLKNG